MTDPTADTRNAITKNAAKTAAAFIPGEKMRKDDLDDHIRRAHPSMGTFIFENYGRENFRYDRYRKGTLTKEHMVSIHERMHDQAAFSTYGDVQEHEHGEGTNPTEVSRTLSLAGFDKTETYMGRITGHSTSGFDLNQRGTEVEVSYTHTSTSTNYTERSDAERAKYLPRYREALEAAGYSVRHATDDQGRDVLLVGQSL